MLETRLEDARRTNEVPLEISDGNVPKGAVWLPELLTTNPGEAISADNRFAVAYEAAPSAAKIPIACAGYRVKGQAKEAL